MSTGLGSEGSATEATGADAADQRATPARDAALGATPEVPLEADAADVLDQASTVGAGEHVAGRDLPLEVDPADAAEQAVVVEDDDEERR